MLHFRPDLVKREAIRDYPSKAEDYASGFARLRVTQPVGFGWMAQDLNADGVVGEAQLATPEKGTAIAAHVTTEFVKLLREVAAFDLANLRTGTLS